MLQFILEKKTKFTKDKNKIFKCDSKSMIFKLSNFFFALFYLMSI